MKKYSWIILLIAIGTISVIVYLYSSNSKPNSDYSAKKSNLNVNSFNSTNSSSNNISTVIPKSPVENELSIYSTAIKNPKDSNRQKNISITCSALNNTIVKPGETFSFCDTVGPSTEERGYKIANVIIQGTETKGLGGGNCQVSSTLYNAVLAVPNELEVVERHPHSAPVPYIEKGKDAAISYRNSRF